MELVSFIWLLIVAGLFAFSALGHIEAHGWVKAVICICVAIGFMVAAIRVWRKQ